jgi:hypothetical protein
VTRCPTRIEQPDAYRTVSFGQVLPPCTPQSASRVRFGQRCRWAGHLKQFFCGAWIQFWDIDDRHPESGQRVAGFNSRSFRHPMDVFPRRPPSRLGTLKSEMHPLFEAICLASARVSSKDWLQYDISRVRSQPSIPGAALPNRSRLITTKRNGLKTIRIFRDLRHASWHEGRAHSPSVSTKPCVRNVAAIGGCEASLGSDIERRTH